MKTLCLVPFLICSFFYQDIIAQDYHPFPQSNAIWNSVGDNMFSGNLWRFRYGVQGDTIINNTNYTKVYSLFDTTLVHPWSTYFGGLRENDNKQVFLLMPGFEETILYDFSLEVGDTIWFNIGGGLCYDAIDFWEEEHYKVVSSIDSVQIENNEYRKRWQFEDYLMGDSWIEGIGSTIWFGAFNPIISALSLCGDNYSFACFKQNNEVLFLDNDYCDQCFCQLLTQIKKEKPDNAKTINIYPNPASELIFLELNNLGLPQNHVEISNILGEVVYETYLNDKTKTSIKINDWTKGIYLIQVSNSNDQLIGQQKLIIQ